MPIFSKKSHQTKAEERLKHYGRLGLCQPAPSATKIFGQSGTVLYCTGRIGQSALYGVKLS